MSTPCHECKAPSDDGICHQCLDAMFQPIDRGHPKDRDPALITNASSLLADAKALITQARANKERPKR